MDLKEYLQLIRRDIKIFISVAAIIVVSTLAYFYFQKESYLTSLTLNITRSGIEATQDYRYDGFYRLQADEKFAETVVEWFKSPRVAADIYSEAQMNLQGLSTAQLSKITSAEKRSSQIVAVKFFSSTPEAAQKISEAAVKIISQNVEKLNESQKEKSWFEVVAEKPITLKDKPNYKIILLASLLAGIFLAFWTVMFRHYFKN